MRAIALLLVVAALAACGGGESEAPIPDGRHFGYVRALDGVGTSPTLEFDRAQWFSGEDGERAAREDGAIGADEPLSNDYYIRNSDKSVVTLRVADDVRITRVECPAACKEGVAGELAPFAASFTHEGEHGATYADGYRGADSQYWITVEDGVVVAIDEKYIP